MGWWGRRSRRRVERGAARSVGAIAGRDAWVRRVDVPAARDRSRALLRLGSRPVVPGAGRGQAAPAQSPPGGAKPGGGAAHCGGDPSSRPARGGGHDLVGSKNSSKVLKGCLGRETKGNLGHFRARNSSVAHGDSSIERDSCYLGHNSSRQSSAVVALLVHYRVRQEFRQRPGDRT